MKVWKDADEVIKMIHELPSELRNVDREMSKKPNFDKFKNKEGIPRIEQNYILWRRGMDWNITINLDQ